MLCLLLVSGFAYTYPRERLQPDRDAWVKAKIDALVRAARAAYEDDDAQPAYNRVLRQIAATIRRRRLAEDASFVSRYPEFIEYIQAAALDQQPDHELGFTVRDRQYFAATRPFVQIPEFLMTQPFLRRVSRTETLDQAKAYLRQLNVSRAPADQLIFFSYTSRHLGTPDNDDSYRRLLIVVPGNAAAGVAEKWVQFGVTDPRTRPLIRNVSVISAVIAADGTFDTYFKDYFRTYRRNGPITIKGRWELGEGDDNCARCHKSGVLPIFPEADSVPTDEQPAVEAVNRRFMSYGFPRFGGYLDGRKFGPGLGSAFRDSRHQRFGEGFARTAVAQAMNCAACHQHEGLGALNWPMDKTIIQSYVKGGQMPFGSQLGKAEREQLYEKLIEEYFATSDANPGILKSWLLGKLRNQHQ